MKLYTRPRPLHVWQLRPGDQLATMRRGGGLIRSETAYVDEDLDERVVWSVVHSVSESDDGGRVVYHTLGEHEALAGQTVIVREVLEIDPWTYVRPSDVNPND